MLKENDIVRLKRNIENIPHGTIGTILLIYEDGNHFEVEFVDSEGATIDLLTVEKNDIEKVM